MWHFPEILVDSTALSPSSPWFLSNIPIWLQLWRAFVENFFWVGHLWTVILTVIPHKKGTELHFHNEKRTCRYPFHLFPLASQFFLLRRIFQVFQYVTTLLLWRKPRRSAHVRVWIFLMHYVCLNNPSLKERHRQSFATSLAYFN